MAIFTRNTPIRRELTLEEHSASFGESAYQTAREALIRSPVLSIYNFLELSAAQEPGGREPTPEEQMLGIQPSEPKVRIDADTARKRIKELNLKLEVPDNGINEDALNILIERKQDEVRRFDIIDRGPQGFFPTVGRFGVGLAASVLDPINVSTAFVPVINAARYAQLLANAGATGSRVGIRASVGALEGLVGAALVEPIIYGSAQYEQADYDMLDSAINIGFGAVLGSGLHVIGGTGADFYRSYRSKPDPYARLRGLSVDQVKQVFELDNRISAGDLTSEDIVNISANYPPAVLRAAGLIKSQADIDRQNAEISAPPTTVFGENTQVRIGQSTVAARYAVVDLVDVEATMSKADNQWRDRTRRASDAQIREISNNPDYDQLQWSPVMDYGAPTLSNDGLVIGGNGRVMGISTAYDIGKSGTYRTRLMADLDRFGIDPGSIDGMQKPMLVRILTEQVDVKKAAIISNEGGAARMSALEQAGVDADRLGDFRGFDIPDNGDLNTAANRGAIKQWVGQFPVNQQAGLLTSEGYLSKEGLLRLRNAILYRAYGDTPVLKRLVESTDDVSANISTALIRSAGVIADARGRIATGNLYDLDISNDIQVAVAKLGELRSKGMTFDDFEAQGDLLGLDITPEQLLLMRFMDDNIRSARAMASFINEYYAALDRAGDPGQQSMFALEPPTKSQLIDEALDRVENDPSAAAKVERVSAETREAALRVSVAQLAEGRQIEVDPVLDSDPAINTATPDSVLASARENQSAQALISSDPDASVRVDQSVPVTDEAKALDEALNIANDVASRGNDAYKYSRAKEQIDNLGFYSSLQRAVDNIQQNKGSGAQFLAQISKTPGIKPDEIKWTGLDDFLASRKSVTKDEIAEYLQRNKVDVQEVQLGGQANEQSLARITQAEQSLSQLGDEFDAAFGGGRLSQLDYYNLRDFWSSGAIKNNANDLVKIRNLNLAPEELDLVQRYGAAKQEYGNARLAREGANKPKFSQYTLPGGENYREILLTLPDANTAKQAKIDAINNQYNAVLGGRAIADLPPNEKAIIDRLTLEHNAIADAPIGQDYRSSHFDQPNILAHMRVNDRVVDGKKTLFIEEVQSDWHQAGRKKGYSQQFAVIGNKGERQFVGSQKEAQDFLEKSNNPDFIVAPVGGSGVPDAPFKTTWHELALKRAIQEASEKGYDQIAFTTGKTQAERYDLSKQIDRIAITKTGGVWSVNAWKDGAKAITKDASTDADLANLVGKELAEKAIKQGGGEYAGLDLQVGGEGMKGFYDNILPKSLDKLGKKFDAKVSKTQMMAGGKDLLNQKLLDNGYNPQTVNLQQIMADNNGQLPGWLNETDILALDLGMGRNAKMDQVEIWSMDITPAMKESILTEGQPLFARGGKPARAADIESLVAQSFGKSTKKLLEAGNIRIVDTPQNLPSGPHPEDVRGMTAPDGTVYIVARNVDPDQVRGLVLHEVGEHVGMEQMLGKKVYADLQKQFAEGLARGDEAFLEAAARVPDGTKAEHVAAEQLAYLIENAPELPLVKRIIAAIRAWAYKTFEFVRNKIELSEADIRALAISSLHSVARRARMEGELGVMYSRGADQTADMAAELRIFDEAIARAEIYGKAIRAAAERLNDPAAARSAMASSGNLLESEIDDLLVQLQKQNTAVRARLRKVRESATAEDRAAGLQSEAMQAANELANNLVQAAVIQKRNAALNLAAKMKALSFIQSEFAGFEAEGFKALLAGSELRRRGARASVQAEQSQLLGGWMGGIINDMEEAGLWNLFVSETMARETSRALFRIGTDADLSDLPKEAVQMAKIIGKYQNDARNTQNRFGSWIRDLKGYIVRQSHDPYNIRKAGYQEWRDFVLPRLDMEKTFKGFEDIEDALKAAFDDLASGLHLKYQPDDETAMAFRGAGRSEARKASESRVLHFKDGDAWFDYNERFGKAKFADAVLGGLERSARSAGLMKMLGTNPEATLTRMLDEVENNLRADPKAKARFHEERQAIMNLFRHVDGSINIPGSHTAAQIGSGIRVWQSVSKLGGALISSIADIPVYASEQQFQGRGFLSGIGDSFAGLMQGRGTKDQQAIMNNLGVFFESMRNNVLRRFDTEQNIGGAMSSLQNKFFKWNGLTWWTEVLRKSASLSLAADIGASRGLRFVELSTDLQNVLGLYNIDAGKWDLIRLGATKEADGRVYITPESVNYVNRAALENYIQNVGRQVNDASVNNLIQDIQGAMRSMFIDRAEHAVIEPDARTRAFWLRGTNPGTVWGETARFIAQFKSFPTAILQRTIGREIYGRGYDTLGDYLKNGKGDMLGLVNLMAWMTLFGYGAMSIKDLLKGRTPRDPMAPSTWMAAMLQGGAFGIYGDFLFGEMKNRFGNGFLATVAGPTFGLVEDLADLYGRLRDGDDAAAKAFRVLVSNTPFANLFYTRMALDYLFLYRIQEWMNPGYLRRMERRIEKENAQTFLISPSEVVQ